MTTKHSFIHAVILAAFLCLPCRNSPAAPGDPLWADSSSWPHRKDQILVKLRAGTMESQRVELRRAGQRGAYKAVKAFPALGNIQVIGLPPGIGVEEALAHFRQSPLVEFAQPDYQVRAATMPNDPKFVEGLLWALRNDGNEGGIAGADIGAVAGWEVRHSAPEIVVAVLDSGVRYTHEDLAGNMWINPGETGLDAEGRDKASNGIDDDGSGFIDDVHGVNLIDRSGDPMDDFGHGTLMAGIIGAVGNNETGMAGVAWSVRIMACKFMDSNGWGDTSGVIEGLDYARRMGADIINGSFDTGPFPNDALREAIQRLGDSGIIFVAAAGNENIDLDRFPRFPAAYDFDHQVTVGATDRADRWHWNHGAMSVHLGAPGMGILSTGHESDSDYAIRDGSSVAAPFVSGTLALLKAQFPSESPAQLINRLVAGADPIDGLSGKSRAGRRLNLAGALNTPDSRPHNDDFSGRTRIGQASFKTAGSILDATVEPGEPDHAPGLALKTIWWSWRAPHAGTADIQATSAGTAPVVALYQGDSLGELRPVILGRHSPGATNTLVSLETEADEVYQIAFGAPTHENGAISWGLDLQPRPLNDSFSGAIPISGSDSWITNSTRVATREMGEPEHGGFSTGRSVWYRWQTPRSKRVTMSAHGSAFDTVLAVYTGTALGSLSLIVANDNPSEGVRASEVTFDAVAGTIYFIAIDGAGGAAGPFILRVPAANDDFEFAEPLDETPFAVFGSTTHASMEPDEPHHSNPPGGHSLWWSWTAPSSGVFNISTDRSQTPVTPAVYQGAGLTTLDRLAPVDAGRLRALTSQVSVEVEEGRTYYLAVENAGDSTGRFKLIGSFEPLMRRLEEVPESHPFSEATSINAEGNIAGYLRDAMGEDHRAFLWTQESGFQVLSQLHGEALAINDRNQVVGWIREGHTQPVLWEQGQMTRLAVNRYGKAKAINNKGEVAGYLYNDAFAPVAVLWKEGQTIELGILPNHIASWANAINELGQVVGMSLLDWGIPRAFLWENGRMVELAPLPGDNVAEAYDINNYGDIVGYSGPPLRAVIWRAGKPSVLSSGHLQASLRGESINDRGQITGSAPFQAVYWRDPASPLIELTEIRTPGWDEANKAPAINESGYLVGSGYNGPGPGIQEAVLAYVMGPFAPQPFSVAVISLAPVADTSLLEKSPDNNLGANSTLLSGTLADGRRGRALVRFDLAGQIPPGGVITSAGLSVRAVDESPAAADSMVDLHRMLRDWNEGEGRGELGSPAANGETTWNFRFFPDDLWALPGAAPDEDYASASSASQEISGPGWFLFESSSALIEDVQLWRDEPRRNFGWMLINRNESEPENLHRFGARESGPDGPILRVGYSTPVRGHPLIISQPQSRIVSSGDDVRFDVAAMGPEPLSFRWTRNGTVLADTPHGTWTILNVQPADSGDYRVEVINPAGSAWSEIAVLEVTHSSIPPQISAAVININNQEIVLHFTVPPGSHLVLEAAAALPTDAWTILTQIAGEIQPVHLTFTDAIAERDRRFYRLRLLDPEP